ncbi:hypothetical protein ACSNOI_39895, partial [Actinomadura kijaniata]
APAASSQSDTSDHKLPTVDELLQRIQTDRQRSAGGSEPPGSKPSFGNSLSSDPLGDPLGSGTPSFGTPGPSWSSGGGPSTPPPATPGFSGFDTGTGGQSTQGGGDGFPPPPSPPSSPSSYGDSSYGDSSRYDDPLNPSGRDSYGSFGGEQTGGNEPGRYTDFSGSSYNGGSDPLAAPHDSGSTGGYGDPNATQAYGGGSGYYPSQQGYSGTSGSNTGDPGANPYGSSYPTPNDQQRQQPDDWENHRDYRR